MTALWITLFILSFIIGLVCILATGESESPIYVVIVMVTAMMIFCVLLTRSIHHDNQPCRDAGGVVVRDHCVKEIHIKP